MRDHQQCYKVCFVLFCLICCSWRFFFFADFCGRNAFSWQNVSKRSSCCVFSDTLQRQRPKSNEEETISSCWLVTTIDQVLLVKVPTFAMLSLWSHILNKWTLHHWQTQRDAGICLSIWKWTLTINGHLIEVTICTWTLWETRHHPKQPYIRPHPTTNLSTFQPNGH